MAIAGLLVGIVIAKMPGRGGHEPSEGIKTGPPTLPNQVPGIVLAGLATLGLGFVLGPEMPLIGLATGRTIFLVRRMKKDAPDMLVGVLAAAAAFAAISTIFGSPIIGAVVLIEAAGLGGPTLALVLLPGLMAAGIGSLVFIGMGSWTGLSTSAWALEPLSLPPYSGPDWSDFGWTLVLAPAAGVGTFVIVMIGRRTAQLVAARPLLVPVLAGLAVAGLAIAFHESTDESVAAVLFSGQEAFGALFDSSYALSTLTLLLLFKGLAWGVSLGSARGGPTFPALFLGAVVGLMCADLPGFAETQAVAVFMGAACVAVLRLPLASVIVAALLTVQAGINVIPLIILAVVEAYIVVEILHARFAATSLEPAENAAEAPVAAGT
jgi:H+/Cl- antiporter ClcA